MKKTISIILVALMLMGVLSGCASTPAESSESQEDAAKNKEYVVKVGYGTNPGHPIDLASVKFEEDTEKKAADLGYQLDVQLFPSAQLGSEKEMVQQLQTGTLDMCPTTTGPLGLFEKKFLVFDLPYIFLSEEHVDSVLDGEIGQEMLTSLEGQGIIGLAWWENGFRQLTNNVREITKPSDLDGIKIRTMQNDVHIDFFTNMGASPTPLGFGEVYTSLQAKIINAQENPFSIIATNNFHDVQPYVTKSDHVYSPVAVLYSKASMEKLPEALQTIIKDTAFEVRLYEREQGRSQQADYINTIEEKSTVYYLTEEEKKAFQEAAMPTYDKFKEVIGVELFEKVLNSSKK